MEKGRLARAARAHDSEKFASGDREVGTAKRRRLAEGQHGPFASTMGPLPAPLGEPMGAHDAHLLRQHAEPSGGQVDPAKVRFEVEQAVVGEQSVDHGAFRLSSVSSRMRWRWAPRWVSR